MRVGALFCCATSRSQFEVLSGLRSKSTAYAGRANCSRTDYMEFAHGPAQALIIGPVAVQTPLERLFARSHWILERQSTLNEGVERLRQERFPAVFCQADDCRLVARAIARLKRPPLIFALSSEDTEEDDWIEAVAHNVYRMTAGGLAPSRLFALLNHAWRRCNEDGHGSPESNRLIDSMP